uniref:FYVE-type domain-containing protein n=1 Tax=Phytophthora ramorum TaxID=164328 RepID=H3GDG4_PHYRM
MKGSWSKNVFPTLTLSAEQQSKFRHLARGLVRETLSHFNAFDNLSDAKKDFRKQKRWKAVKTRDNFTVFKERDPPKTITGTSFDTPEHQRLAEDEWQMPKLLVGVGSIVGSLDDVMYGVVTPDARAMLLKASIVRSSLVDGAVLAQIDGPTPEEPYRFLGVKWFVKGPPATLRRLVQPRDLVFVESTGTLTQANGDRIGYQLLHSVDIDGYGALPERSLTRGRISSCTIFKETQGGRRVDVYVRGYVEQHGKLLDSVALKAASTGFLSSWNAVECGHVKKLMWFVENPQLVGWKEDAVARARSPVARAPVRLNASSFDGPSGFHLRNLSLASPNDRCGGTCGRKLKKVNSVGLCSLCQVPMCSKCRVTKKLAYATCELKLKRRESTICRSCVAKVRLEPVRRIAQQEIRQGRYGRHPSSDHPRAQPIEASVRTPVARSPSSRSLRSKQTQSSGSHFHFSDSSSSTRSNASASGAVAGSLSRQRLHQLQQQQQQAQAEGSSARLVPRWFRRHKKSEQRSAEPRPVMFGESTTLSDCQTGTLSQCSTVVDSVSTTSPINPLTYSWASTGQESDCRARVEEDDEEDWTKTPEFTDHQQERRQLWHQMTELRLAVENTYQIAKHTTDSCCSPSLSPLGKMY